MVTSFGIRLSQLEVSSANKSSGSFKDHSLLLHYAVGFRIFSRPSTLPFLPHFESVYDLS